MGSGIKNKKKEKYRNMMKEEGDGEP